MPLFGLIYSYFAPNIPFWSRFSPVYLYFPIFSFIYPHLAGLALLGYIERFETGDVVTVAFAKHFPEADLCRATVDRITSLKPDYNMLH